jgi:hypothetical protein
MKDKSPEQIRLEQTISDIAKAAYEAGITEDAGENSGPLHRWIEQNVKHDCCHDFEIVFCASIELWHHRARVEGYADGYTRAHALHTKERI